MSLASKLGLLALAASVGLALYEWELITADPQEMTQTALRQFDDSDTAAQDLRTAGAAKHWWPVAGALVLMLLAALLFWEDARRWWTNEEPQTHPEERGPVPWKGGQVS
jgi:hypothetical protein